MASIAVVNCTRLNLVLLLCCRVANQPLLSVFRNDLFHKSDYPISEFPIFRKSSKRSICHRLQKTGRGNPWGDPHGWQSAQADFQTVSNQQQPVPFAFTSSTDFSMFFGS